MQKLDDCNVKLPLNIFHLPHRSLLELARFWMTMSNAAFERAVDLRERERSNAQIAEKIESYRAAGFGELIDETIPSPTIEAWAKEKRSRERLAKRRGKKNV